MAQYKGASTEADRGLSLARQREQDKLEFEKKKKLINEKNQLKDLNSKFKTHHDGVQAALSDETVGLVLLEDFKRKRETLEKLAQNGEALNTASEVTTETSKKKKKRKKSKIPNSILSFEDEDEDHGDEVLIVKKVKSNNMKNPNVTTDFLPDKERKDREEELKQNLRQKFLRDQTRVKDEDISITYSYWDGFGHRRSVNCKKGDSIRKFIEKALQQTLRGDFLELKTIGADSLLYIKEDLIIPQHYSFYDFIVNKTRGKSGPLFKFDVHDDVRLTNDATVEKDETHAGKIVLKTWYDRNKHMFPASRWERFDPDKDYGQYAISDNAKK